MSSCGQSRSHLLNEKRNSRRRLAEAEFGDIDLNIDRSRISIKAVRCETKIARIRLRCRWCYRWVAASSWHFHIECIFAFAWCAKCSIFLCILFWSRIQRVMRNISFIAIVQHIQSVVNHQIMASRATANVKVWLIVEHKEIRIELSSKLPMWNRERHRPKMRRFEMCRLYDRSWPLKSDEFKTHRAIKLNHLTNRRSHFVRKNLRLSAKRAQLTAKGQFFTRASSFCRSQPKLTSFWCVIVANITSPTTWNDEVFFVRQSEK